MRSFSPRRVFPLAYVALVASCSSGGTTTTKTQTMVKLAGDAQSATAGTAVTTKPSVKITDQNFNAVQGVSVTFAVASGGGSVAGASAMTGSDGVATVGSWTLGATAGANTLTASASGVTGSPVTFTATGTLAAFSPTSNTTLSGTQNFASVNIPAGVTVTMTANTTINVGGAVTIAGTLAGDCVNLTLTATGALNSSGNINNGCAGAFPASGPPSMTLVAVGGYHLTAGTITLGGSLNLTNDVTLTDGSFPAPPAGLGIGGAHLSSGVCSVGAAGFVANPVSARAGADGNPNGAKGDDGATWVLQCTGELDLNGAVNVVGQAGGAGGAGTNSSATAANSTGGPGSVGGIIKVRSNNGDLVFSGAANNIVSGNGGAGGPATATGIGAGNPGASATSFGGAGAAPGNIVLQAVNGGITINSGAVNLIVGSGGNGGAATSIGGLGQTATPCPAGAGGVATATGGAGGSTPDKTLKATGNVGGVGNVTVGGGNPGIGGQGSATGGNGGNGAQPCKPGGAGGNAAARGGAGGNALLKDANGALFANGGKGGAMQDAIGGGGNGWSDCSTDFEPGGPGGSGGTATGADGNGGSGKTRGADGGGTITTMGNGGNGGDGAGPGAGGPGGSQSTTVTGGLTIIQPSFKPGIPGNVCQVTKVATFTTNPTLDPNGHEAFLQLTTALHSGVILTVGASGEAFITNLITGVTFTGSINLSNGQFTFVSAPAFFINGIGPLTANYTGTLTGTTLDGILTITGTPVGPVSYHVVDP